MKNIRSLMALATLGLSLTPTNAILNDYDDFDSPRKDIKKKKAPGLKNKLSLTDTEKLNLQSLSGKEKKNYIRELKNKKS